MIRHLLKLVWRRKRANALIMTEMFLSFLVAFAVAMLGVALLVRWHAPLGFSPQNVWVISFDELREAQSASHQLSTEEYVARARKRIADSARDADRLLRELRAFPQIESAAAEAMPPYSGHDWITMVKAKGTFVDVNADAATDDLAKVLGIRMLRGRWFEPADDARNFIPVVLNPATARRLFGDDDPIGQTMPASSFSYLGTLPSELRVVGVMASFRNHGELSPADGDLILFRSSLNRAAPPGIDTLVLRVRPGTPASFEADLTRRMHALAPDINFRVRRMEQMRVSLLREMLVPLGALAIVACFLISMVALGLSGVLWQTVTRRIRELGLRRALGATGPGVRAQVIAEVVLLATLAIAAGVAVVIQLPLIGWLGFVTRLEFLLGLSGAVAAIYGIALLCGLYPGWLASTIEPADALRYE